jgi:hypothetical protein
LIEDSEGELWWVAVLFYARRFIGNWMKTKRLFVETKSSAIVKYLGCNKEEDAGYWHYDKFSINGNMIKDENCNDFLREDHKMTINDKVRLVVVGEKASRQASLSAYANVVRRNSGHRTLYEQSELI